MAEEKEEKAAQCYLACFTCLSLFSSHHYYTCYQNDDSLNLLLSLSVHF